MFTPVLIFGLMILSPSKFSGHLALSVRNHAAVRIYSANVIMIIGLMLYLVLKVLRDFSSLVLLFLQVLL